MGRSIPKATDIKYTKKDVRQAASRPTLPHGLHFFVPVKAEMEVVEKGDYAGSLVCALRVAALKDPEDANTKVRPQMREGLWMPFANPDVPGHKAPDFAGGMAYQHLAAAFEDEIPAMPKKDRDGNLVFKGEVIAEAGDAAMDNADQEARDEVMQLVFDKCLEILDNPKLLLKGGFYGLVGLDRKQGKYTNILAKYSTPPEDLELFDWSKVAAATEDEDEEPVTSRAATKKAPAAKSKRR